MLTASSRLNQSPLATAIEIIDTLLQNSSTNIRNQYARWLANQVKSSSPLDCTPEDRSQLLHHDSTLRCLLITQGSLSRNLCREHPAFQSFLASCSIAINEEVQHGGQAGSTILASFLDRRCLQLLIGDKEQTRSGTGGEPTKGSPPNETCHEVGRFSQQPFSFLALGICRKTRQGSPSTRPLLYPYLTSLMSIASPSYSPIPSPQLSGPPPYTKQRSLPSLTYCSTSYSLNPYVARRILTSRKSPHTTQTLGSLNSAIRLRLTL